MMNRRTFAASAALLAAAPFMARAQQRGRTYRIVWHSPSLPVAEMTEALVPNQRVFYTELRRLGFTEGRNLEVLRFSAEGDSSRNAGIAHEIVRAQPDVAVIIGEVLPEILLGLTDNIPIVVPGVTDLVASGLAQSVARPGRNLTGFDSDAGLEMHGKRLQLLKDVVPGARRIVYLGGMTGWARVSNVMREAAAALRVDLVLHPIAGPYDEAMFRVAFSRLAADRPDAIYVAPSNPINVYRRLVVDLTAALGVPAIYGHRLLSDAGGLMSYAGYDDDIWHGAAGYVARILNGEKAGDLPIQLPTRFEFIINLKTARSLGLKIPESLLVFATEVIE
jgi:putative tryptophan/tyrosine transport system substrate-binding protein